ncbi:MAG: polynucleotide adenylyltransferase PcnB [Guyparkeria sp.]|uniref:polynucleotide adenylyltransferase PcnB n=1 Tax=Guyparkeria sp. TaxID=2035736 RepID=UPI0039799B33
MTPSHTRIPAESHGISLADLSDNARFVLEKLHEAGYEAYAVGGCVRDLLRGRSPKDFDVVTDARPEEVKRLFKRARIIGRRFKIVHVVFRDEVIEVTTFRGGDAGEVQRADGGMITRDNVFGTIDEDVWRRDFACNALYLDYASGELVDYVEGFSDIRGGRLRVIGEPESRYREDPVRMLRAARFAAKLGFHLTEDSERAIAHCRDTLEAISPARLFDETVKLMQGGAGRQTFLELRRLGLLEYLFDGLSTWIDPLDPASDWPLIEQVLNATDDRVARDLPVNPAFLFAGLFWRMLGRHRIRWMQQRVPSEDAMVLAADEVLGIAARKLMIPRRLAEIIRAIWMLQADLERLVPTGDAGGGKSAEGALSDEQQALMQSPWFRAAVDFLCLRSTTSEVDVSVCEAWRRYAPERSERHEPAVEALKPSDFGKKRRRRPRRRKPAGARRPAND